MINKYSGKLIQQRALSESEIKFIHSIKAQFDKVSYQNQRRLSRALRDFACAPAEKSADLMQEITLKTAAACEDLAERIKSLPKISYDAALPVSARREDIIKAIKENQVVIIAGETGSGKTTQIPKMCLEAGLGRRGLIGHTQPRRIAARAVAARIADELGTPLGQNVGYKVRFSDTCAPSACIKIMTDGILLAETQHDRLLLEYDCIIIDEAHERSLNIDFLLGYLKRLLKIRPELKLIVTSATIDPERFSAHFNQAPIIEVSGRTYPVEVVYMPLGRFSNADEVDNPEDAETEELDVRTGVLKALHFLMDLGRGDVLVFLPGERDIMELSAFLKKADLRDTEIVPLYARLATADQNRIFAPHSGVRVVLSTNVAETSLTVPGIRYVIDTGKARISRYSAKTKVQRLPIEPISQASANQRKGRCGRVSNGVCVRLYSEEDFLSRPLYTDPEILRTNLASVILQMAALRLGSIEDFPFIDPPAMAQITDGMRLLDELGAIQVKSKDTEHLKLTAIGHTLSRIPVDPRLGRMLIEAAKRGCLSEVSVIVAALAVIDPRESPLDKKEASAQLHARFKDEKSDFLSFIKLYRYICDLQKELSSSALRRRLKKEFISYLRVREWLDVLRQLKASCQVLKYKFNEVASGYEEIHRALLPGLLSQIGMLDTENRIYRGARGLKFVIFPTSSLAKKPPKWICAAELSETSRLFARTVAAIDPLWAEEAGAHLIRKSYAEPHWSKKQGAVLASMTVSLYGLPLATGRLVQYSSIDPNLCRELLIRDGLVAGECAQNFSFLKHNQDLIASIEHLEDKSRRRDLLAEDSLMEEFYNARLPQDILSIRALAFWWKQKQKEDPKYLNISYEELAKDGTLAVTEDLYPEFWTEGTLKFKLSYVFDPRDQRDGVSVHIPVTVINQVRAEDFAWQIPGLRNEFLAELIRSLPKRLRRNLIPAPDYAKALAQALNEAQGNIYVKAAKELTRMGGEIVTPDDFDLGLVPAHLFVTFVIEDLQGHELACGKDFSALSQKLQGHAHAALQQAVKKQSIQKPAGSWRFGTIKPEQIMKQGSMNVSVYPALKVKDDGVVLEMCMNQKSQARTMWQGQRKLLALSVRNPVSYLTAHLPNKAKLAMYYQPLGRVQDLIFDIVLAAIDEIMRKAHAPVWNESDFLKLQEEVKANVADTALQIAAAVEPILIKAHELKRSLRGRISLELARCYNDVDQQTDSLVHKGFVSEFGLKRLQDFPRYLEAALQRLKKAARDPNRDSLCQRKIEDVSERLHNLTQRYAKDCVPDDLQQVRWMIEELRVSFFAQQLGTAFAISDKRIDHELDRIQKEFPPQH